MANHQSTSKSITNLIEQFSKLPGIGPKSAQRLTYYMVKVSKEQAFDLSHAISELKEKTNPFTLLISGVGKEWNSLERQIKQNNYAKSEMISN